MGMIQSLAVRFLWSSRVRCGNAAPAHIFLHLPSSRNHFRELAEDQWISSALLIPPLHLTPGLHLKLSGQPLHGKVPAALLGSQLRKTHRFIMVACQKHLCCMGTSLHFLIFFSDPEIRLTTSVILISHCRQTV